MNDNRLPLEDLTVLDFTHNVMGPVCGMILADMGAEVIHIERSDGDPTRRLKGFGTGFFSFYSRNKKSLAIDIKSEKGREIILALVRTADVFIENFGPGTMERLGYGYDTLAAINPKLVYCTLKGFFNGPYEKRHALDEVVQMMGGLAYMTGPSGRPLRAGTSIVDISGGMFGAIGILTALLDRKTTGKGGLVKSALFETTAFLMGQNMASAALSDTPLPPMPERVSSWAVYRLFETRDHESIFVGITSDKHWERFCRTFDRTDLLEDERLKTNNDRIDARDYLMPLLEDMFKQMTMAQALERCEEADIPFSQIARPEDLFDNPQLNNGLGLNETVILGGVRTKLPKLPISVGDADFGLKRHPPEIGQHTREVLRGMGYTEDTIETLMKENVVAGP